MNPRSRWVRSGGRGWVRPPSLFVVNNNRLLNHMHLLLLWSMILLRPLMLGELGLGSKPLLVHRELLVLLMHWGWAWLILRMHWSGGWEVLILWGWLLVLYILVWLGGLLILLISLVWLSTCFWFNSLLHAHNDTKYSTNCAATNNHSSDNYNSSVVWFFLSFHIR